MHATVQKHYVIQFYINKVCEGRTHAGGPTAGKAGAPFYLRCLVIMLAGSTVSKSNLVLQTCSLRVIMLGEAFRIVVRRFWRTFAL